MPNITGEVGIDVGYGLLDNNVGNSAFGAFTKGSVVDYGVAGDANIPNPTNIKFDASRSNPIYGKATTVQPPSISLIPQIKF